MSVDINMPVGDIIAKDIRKAGILSSYGIDFCCGGKKALAEACSEKNIDVNTILRQFEHLDDENPGPVNRFNEWDTGFLIDYIVHNHHLYLKRELPHINQHVEKVASRHGANHPELKELLQHFMKLRQDIEQHLEKEERVLFPYIKKLLQIKKQHGQDKEAFKGSIAQPISVMEAEHDSAGKILRDMRGITMGYTLPEDACNTYRLAFAQLQDLEADLHQHIHLENNILFPEAARLEQTVING